jgi:filamentous hemagglutinin
MRGGSRRVSPEQQAVLTNLAYAGLRFRFNRQLHLEEKQRIRNFTGKGEVKEARLAAEACTMAKCYAEYPEDSVAYQHFKQIAEFGASDALADERQILSQQDGLFGYTTSGLLAMRI